MTVCELKCVEWLVALETDGSEYTVIKSQMANSVALVGVDWQMMNGGEYRTEPGGTRRKYPFIVARRGVGRVSLFWDSSRGNGFCSIVDDGPEIDLCWSDIWLVLLLLLLMTRW